MIVCNMHICDAFQSLIWRLHFFSDWNNYVRIVFVWSIFLPKYAVGRNANIMVGNIIDAELISSRSAQWK